MGVYLAVNSIVLLMGIRYGGITGIYVALAGLVVGAIAQVVWLGFRNRAAQRVTIASPGA